MEKRSLKPYFFPVPHPGSKKPKKGLPSLGKAKGFPGTHSLGLKYFERRHNFSGGIHGVFATSSGSHAPLCRWPDPLLHFSPRLALPGVGESVSGSGLGSWKSVLSL